MHIRSILDSKRIGCTLWPALRLAVIGGCLLSQVFSASGAPQGPVFRHPWANEQPILQRLAAQYRTETGVNVTVIYRPLTGDPAGSPQKAVPEADIIGLRHCGADDAAIAALARQGKAQDISAWVDEDWRSEFVQIALRPFILYPDNPWSAPRGIYGLPISAYVQLFIYRPDLLARAGIYRDPIHWRWKDFLEAGHELSRQGIEPLVGAFHQRSHPALAQMYEASYLGRSELLRTYQGSLPYTDVQWHRFFQVYTDLRGAGIGTTPLALDNRAVAEDAFLTGRAAMLVDGPWFGRIQKTRAPGVNGWKVFSPPWDEEQARFMPAVPGGPGESVIVNPRSMRRKQAVDFLRWLTDVKAQAVYANSSSMLPATRTVLFSPALDPHLQVFARYLITACPDISYNENQKVNSVHYEGVLNILRGRANSIAVLSRIERAKAQLRSGKQLPRHRLPL